jgi:hypothetical protein
LHVEGWDLLPALAASSPAILAGGLAKDLLLAAAYWLLLVRVGSLVLKAAGLRVEPRAERILLSAGLGLGTVSIALLLLGLAGLWKPVILQALFWSGLALCAAELAFRRREPEAEPGPRSRFGPWEWAALLLLAAVTLMDVLAAAAPEIFYDSLVYHLALPKLYLLRGSITPTPENIYSGIPFVVQMLYGPALAVSGEDLAALLHLSFGLGTAGVMWVWARRFAQGGQAGLFSALLFCLCPVSFYAGWNAGVDLGASFLTAAAFLALCRSLSAAEDASSWSLAAGLLTGFAMGTKYNAFAMGAAFVAVHGWLARRQGLPFRASLLFGGAAAAALSPWLAKNLLFYGNPVYPFLYLKLGRIAPADWTSFMAAAGSRPLSVTFGSWTGFKDALLFPWTVSLSDWPMGDWPGASFLVLAPLAFLRRWGVVKRDGSTPPAFTALAVLSLAGLLSWCFASRLVRYVLPALPVLCMTTAVAVERGGWPGWLRRLAWLTTLYAGLFNVDAGLRQGQLIGLWDVLTGRESRVSFLSKQRVTYGLPYYAAAEFIDRELPKDAKVLFLGESRAFYCERDFIAATIYDHNPFWAAVRECRSAQELAERVRRLGVTHVFVSARQFVYRKESANILPRDLARSEAFLEFWARWLKPLFEDREDGPPNPRWLVVYELRRQPLDAKDARESPMNPARFAADFLDSATRT